MIDQMTVFKFREEPSTGEQWDCPIIATPHDPTFESLCVQLAQVWEVLADQHPGAARLACVGVDVTRGERTHGDAAPTVYRYDAQWDRWTRVGGEN